MKFLCNLVGHKLPTGYCGAPPYLSIKSTVTDGIGIRHALLYAKCDRCGKEYHVASTHLLDEVKKDEKEKAT